MHWLCDVLVTVGISPHVRAGMKVKFSSLLPRDPSLPPTAPLPCIQPKCLAALL